VEAALGLEAVTRDRAAVGSYFLLVRLGCLGVERDIVEGGNIHTRAEIRGRRGFLQVASRAALSAWFAPS
jgi:hypothetical protein